MAKAKVVASLLTQDQDFQKLQAADAAAAAQRSGLDLEVVFAKNNSRLQIEQLYHFIHAVPSARPVAIVVQTVAGDGLPRVARDAAKAGIGWLLLNREGDSIEELRAEYPSLPIGIVTIDQLGIGRIQGAQFRALLPNGGNALYVQGPPDTSAASERLRGLHEVIANAGIELKILNAEWTEASSEKVVALWLSLSSSRDYPLKLAGAQNDAMALGARKAIATARPEWLQCPFTGCDGLPDGGQRLVRERQLAATVIVPPTAGAAINLVATHARDKSPISARVVLAPRAYPALS